MFGDERGEQWLRDGKAVPARDRGGRLVHGLAPELGTAVIQADDERIGVFGDELPHALAQSLHRLTHQRPPYARSLACLGVEEDGRARQAPVDERGHRHPRELAWPRRLGVGCLWPVDLYAV